MSLGNQAKSLSDSKHKEESAGRIKSDSVDREKIISSLQQCIHPLQIESHASNTLVNVYTGEISEQQTNTNFAPSPKGLKQGATTTQGRVRVAMLLGLRSQPARGKPIPLLVSETRFAPMFPLVPILLLGAKRGE